MKSLKEIEDKYLVIDQVLNSEEEKFKDWDQCVEKSIRSVEFERDVYLALVDTLYTTKGKSIFQDIIATSAEYTYLSSIIDRGKRKDTRCDLKKAFHVNFSDLEYNDNQLGNRLFVSLSLEELKAFLGTSR